MGDMPRVSLGQHDLFRSARETPQSVSVEAQNEDEAAVTAAWCRRLWRTTPTTLQVAVVDYLLHGGSWPVRPDTTRFPGSAQNRLYAHRCSALCHGW